MDECCNEGETSSATPPQRPQLGDPGTQKGAERWKHHHWVPPIPTANVSFLVPQIRLKAKNIQDNPLVLGWQAGNNKKEIQLAMSLCVCVCVSGCLCVTERGWSRETHRASEKIDCTDTLERWNHLQRIPDIYEVLLNGIDAVQPQKLL